jgi:N-acetylglucosamine kinase-like BadF-type ATPase
MTEPSVFQKQASKTWIGVDIGGTKTAVVVSSRPPGMLAHRVSHLAGRRSGESDRTYQAVDSSAH